MGNSCCSQRFSRFGQSKSQSLQERSVNANVIQDIKVESLVEDGEIDCNLAVEKDLKGSLELEINKNENASKVLDLDSRVSPSAFPFSFLHSTSLTNNARKVVTQNFSPTNRSSEKIIGHISSTTLLSKNSLSSIIVLTNYALYIIESKTDSNISKKILISSIVFILISEQSNEILLQISPKLNQNDQVFQTEKLKDFFYYLQSTHFTLFQFYIPYKTLPQDRFTTYIKVIPTSLLKKLSETIYKQVLIEIFGLIDLTENLEFVMKCKGLEYKLEDIFVALTNEALFTLNQYCKVKSRLEYEKISSLMVSPGMEKVVIIESDGKKTFFLVGNTFLGKLQKYYSKKVNRKLRINIFTEI